jgi:hypothetical protein
VVGCCARSCRGGSIAGVKKGRRSIAEAFIAVRQGGGWVVGSTTRRRGAGEGRGASATVGWRGVAGSGPPTTLAGDAHASGA